MKKVLPVILLSLFIVPMLAFADGVNTEQAICNIFAKIKIILAAVGFGIAVIFLIVGGIKYMTSQGDEEKAKGARGMIINALIGIAIIFAATLLLNIVIGFVSGVGITFNPVSNPCTNLGV